VIFRNAVPNEADILTQLTLESKRYWGYSEEFVMDWAKYLIMHAEYIEKNIVVVAEENEEICGYFSIIEEQSSHIVTIGERTISGGFFLDNLFIRPSYICKGLGKKLFAIALEYCEEKKIHLLHFYSDVNAKGFYEKMGALYVGEAALGTTGRTQPYFTYAF